MRDLFIQEEGMKEWAIHCNQNKSQTTIIITEDNKFPTESSTPETEETTPLKESGLDNRVGWLEYSSSPRQILLYGRLRTAMPY